MVQAASHEREKIQERRWQSRCMAFRPAEPTAQLSSTSSEPLRSCAGARFTTFWEIRGVRKLGRWTDSGWQQESAVSGGQGVFLPGRQSGSFSEGSDCKREAFTIQTNQIILTGEGNFPPTGFMKPKKSFGPALPRLPQAGLEIRYFYSRLILSC